MPIKKINLAPDVKSRLRRAVLGGIDSKAAASLAAIKGKAPAAGGIKTRSFYAAAKPAAKTLKKIIINPRSAKAEKKPLLLEYRTTQAIGATGVKAAAAKPDIKHMIEKKSVAKPVKAAKAKPAKKVAAKQPIRPVAVKPIKPAAAIPAVPVAFSSRMKKPLAYKPFVAAKRDWEKPQKEDSLERLFKGAEKKRTAKSSAFDFSADRAKPARKSSALWLKLAGTLVLLAVLLAGYTALGIYKYGFDDSISTGAAKMLRLPAGFVGNIPIGAGEYLDNMKYLAQPLALNREGLIDYSGKSDLSDRIFFRLAADKLIADRIAAYGKPVTQADIDNQVAVLLKQTGGQAQAEEIINNLYGFDLNRFKSMVLLPMMARANLQAAIISDESLAINQIAKARIDEVMKLAVVSTTDFTALAKQYSDDEASVNTGGDLGWVVRGQLGPAWESSIFTAATGTVISQPIRSDFGYHIVRVDQKLVDKDTGAESVKLRHILIKIDVDQYIKDLLASATIIKYIK